jgi:hypothetical protein
MRQEINSFLWRRLKAAASPLIGGASKTTGFTGGRLFRPALKSERQLYIQIFSDREFAETPISDPKKLCLSNEELACYFSTLNSTDTMSGSYT